MSISKSICLNFSDGIKTVYTRSSTLYIPFEVSYIRIANTYLDPTGASTPTDVVIYSNLVDNDIIAQAKQFSNPNSIKHYFKTPKPINGSYDFSINLSNTFADVVLNTRTGYSLVGTIAIGTDEILLNTVTSLDVFYLSYTQDDFESPGNQRYIRTGVAPYILNTNEFIVLSYDSLTQIIQTTGNASGTLTDADWFMDGNLITISTLSSNLGISSFSNTYVPKAIIKTKLTSDRYRVTTVQTYSVSNPAAIWNNNNLYKFYNLTQCKVIIDLEFYVKTKEVQKVIKNSQYYLWSFTDTTITNKLHNIDVLFPVDEIQIVNSNVNSTVTPFVYNIYSDLVQSSTTDNDLINKNYTNSLGTFVLSLNPYNTNRKKFLYSTPRIINGAYSLYAKYVSTNTDVDYSNDLGDTSGSFHFLFIQYE